MQAVLQNSGVKNRVFKILSSILRLFILDYIYLTAYNVDVDTIFFADKSHMGDIYNYSSIIQSMIEHKYIKSAAIVVPENYAFIPRMFSCINSVQIERGSKRLNGHARIIYISKTQRDFIPKLLKNFIYNFKMLKFFFVLPIMLVFNGHKNDNSTLNYIFGKTLPCFKRYSNFAKPDLKIYDYEREVSDFFSKHGAIAGRTLVIAPESNSGSHLPIGVLSIIIETVKVMGFTFIINATSEEFRNVTGTSKIPLELFQSIVNRAGYLLSVRSGICDLVSYSNVNIMILYDQYHLEFFENDGLYRFPGRLFQVVLKKPLDAMNFPLIVQEFLG